MPRVMKEIPNEHFKILVKVKNELTPIVDEFGNPCKDYCEGCASCDAWKRVITFLTGTPNNVTWGGEMNENETDIIAITEIARVALKNKDIDFPGGEIGRQLDLSDEELDRLHEVTKKKLENLS